MCNGFRLVSWNFGQKINVKFLNYPDYYPNYMSWYMCDLVSTSKTILSYIQGTTDDWRSNILHKIKGI